MTSDSPDGDRGDSRPTRDPKTIVTHHAFRVDPDLLGRPLAGPGRRLLGIFVDLCVLGLLFPLRAAASVLLGGIMDLLVALAVAWLLFHLSSQRSRGKVPARGVRWLLRGTAVIIALAGLAGLLGGDDPETGGSSPPAAIVEADSTRRGAGIAALQAIPGVSGTTVEVDGRSIPLGEMAEGATARIDSLARESRRDADSILVRYARALTADDTAAADSLRPLLRTAVAGDEIEELREENDELEDEVDELEDELEDARDTPGLVDRTVTLVTEDLGIGLGWLGIYFTAFLALWGGRTPGKRLLGMRVVKLNGEPLGWWASFERFGGYAAGLATGLMGFAEIFWDPNRQAIHDKVTGTVVVRTRGAPYEAWKTGIASRSGTGQRSSGAAGFSGVEGPHPHLDADR